MQITREQPRLPLHSRVFIELESPAAGSTADAQIAVCQTMDISSQGLQLAIPQELTVGAYLQIGVEPPGVDDDTFFLAGQVRWCRPSDDPEYPWLAGFVLLPAEHSDMARWVELTGSST